MLSSYSLMILMLVLLHMKSLLQLLDYSKIGSVLINYFRIKFSFSKPNDGSGLFHRLAEYVGASTVNVPNIMIYD